MHNNVVYIGFNREKPLIDLTKERMQDVQSFVEDRRLTLLSDDPEEMRYINGIILDVLDEIADVIIHGYVDGN